MRYFICLFPLFLFACQSDPSTDMESPAQFMDRLTEIVRAGDEKALFEAFINTEAEATILVNALSSPSRDPAAKAEQVANIV